LEEADQSILPTVNLAGDPTSLIGVFLCSNIAKFGCWWSLRAFVGIDFPVRYSQLWRDFWQVRYEFAHVIHHTEKPLNSLLVMWFWHAHDCFYFLWIRFDSFRGKLVSDVNNTRTPDVALLWLELCNLKLLFPTFLQTLVVFLKCPLHEYLRTFHVLVCEILPGHFRFQMACG
jgi:hypothetical protein